MRIYNTLSRKKEEFIPQQKGRVKFYSCGQTVYDDLHLGNARTYSNWDLMVRYLRWVGLDVFHVQNFTDVGHLTDDADAGEDKIEKRAKLRKLEPLELVDTQIMNYWKDIDELNIQRPNISPRATGHIIEMQDMIKSLLDKGFAYEINGNVYFDTSKFMPYAKLAKLKLIDLKEGARVEKDINKRNPTDFALWLKAPENHLMKWSSPWGKGYPGWHIECSVMSLKYLGPTLDIHAGGIDHIPVHHTNEVAQSESYTGKKFANYWIHSAFITINGEKMSKSKGNFITAREAINKWGSDAVRMALVSGHYRSQIDFNEGMMSTAINSLDRIKNMVSNVNHQSIHGKKSLNQEVTECVKAFTKAMDDDFNTPEALASIYALVKAINSSLGIASKESVNQAKDKVIELLNVLGVRIELSKKEGDLNKVMNILINARLKARESKNYELSDYIRTELSNAGITLEDTKEGIKWFVTTN